MRIRDSHRLENSGERIGTPGQLGVPMLHETVPNDQAQRNRSPASNRKSIRPPKNEVTHGYNRKICEPLNSDRQNARVDWKLRPSTCECNVKSRAPTRRSESECCS